MWVTLIYHDLPFFCKLYSLSFAFLDTPWALGILEMDFERIFWVRLFLSNSHSITQWLGNDYCLSLTQQSQYESGESVGWIEKSDNCQFRNSLWGFFSSIFFSIWIHNSHRNKIIRSNWSDYPKRSKHYHLNRLIRVDLSIKASRACGPTINCRPKKLDI